MILTQGALLPVGSFLPHRQPAVGAEKETTTVIHDCSISLPFLGVYLLAAPLPTVCPPLPSILYFLYALLSCKAEGCLLRHHRLIQPSPMSGQTRSTRCVWCSHISESEGGCVCCRKITTSPHGGSRCEELGRGQLSPSARVLWSSGGHGFESFSSLQVYYQQPPGGGQSGSHLLLARGEDLAAAASGLGVLATDLDLPGMADTAVQAAQDRSQKLREEEMSVNTTNARGQKCWWL